MIRLQRIGRKHDPHFRIVVTEKERGPKSGKFIEILGSYNPKAGEIKINEERAKYWISMGAQTSGTMHNFLVDKGAVAGKKRNVSPKRKPKKEEPKVEEAPKPATEVKEEAPVAEETHAESAEIVEKPEEVMAPEATAEPVPEAKVEEEKN